MPFFLSINIAKNIAIATARTITMIQPVERPVFVGSLRFSIFGGKAVGAKPISNEVKFKTV